MLYLSLGMGLAAVTVTAQLDNYGPKPTMIPSPNACALDRHCPIGYSCERSVRGNSKRCMAMAGASTGIPTFATTTEWDWPASQPTWQPEPAMTWQPEAVIWPPQPASAVIWQPEPASAVIWQPKPAVMWQPQSKPAVMWQPPLDSNWWAPETASRSWVTEPQWAPAAVAVEATPEWIQRPVGLSEGVDRGVDRVARQYPFRATEMLPTKACSGDYHCAYGYECVRISEAEQKCRPAGTSPGFVPPWQVDSGKKRWWGTNGDSGTILYAQSADFVVPKIEHNGVPGSVNYGPKIPSMFAELNTQFSIPERSRGYLAGQPATAVMPASFPIQAPSVTSQWNSPVVSDVEWWNGVPVAMPAAEAVWVPEPNWAAPAMVNEWDSWGL